MRKYNNKPNRTSYKNKELRLKEMENGCIECISHKIPKRGYPIITRDKERQKLGKYLYEKEFGKVEKKLDMCHKCDNPKCVNIEHIYFGTRKENVRDMMVRNRNQKGEMKMNSKLKEWQIQEIMKSNKNLHELGKMYKVAPATIRDVKKGKTWKHITKR